MTISGATRSLFVVGDPIAHARSPVLVTAALARRGVDAVLLPMRIAPADLGRFFDAVRIMQSCDGVLVTMPHKEAVLGLVDDATPIARAARACNVVRREASGRLVGDNMDGEGFARGLERRGYALAGRSVALVGAGGAAAGIALALAARGVASIAILNRTAARAEDLAARVRAASPAVAVTVGDAALARADLVVNATSVGMAPDDPLPVDPAALAPHAMVAEVIMRPARTRLLDVAAARGLETQPGEPMLAEQVEAMLDFVLPTR